MKQEEVVHGLQDEGEEGTAKSRLVKSKDEMDEKEKAFR